SNLGFEVIQIHAAHGYLISQSLNPWLNRRRDEYGARPTLLLERVLEAVRASAPTCVLDVRISLIDGVASDAGEATTREEQLHRVVQMGVDMISLSSGMYEVSRHLIYPTRTQGWGTYLPSALRFASDYPQMAWNVAGNIWQLPDKESLPDNLSLSIG